MTDPTFTNINRLFVLSFKSGSNMATRNTFTNNMHYLPLVQIKNFNVLIDSKSFLISL